MLFCAETTNKRREMLLSAIVATMKAHLQVYTHSSNRRFGAISRTLVSIAFQCSRVVLEQQPEGVLGRRDCWNFIKDAVCPVLDTGRA